MAPTNYNDRRAEYRDTQKSRKNCGRVKIRSATGQIGLLLDTVGPPPGTVDEPQLPSFGPPPRRFEPPPVSPG